MVGRNSRFRLVALLCGLLVLSAAGAWAQDTKKAGKPEKPRTKRVQALGETAYRRLTAAQEAMKEENWAKATAEMDSLQRRRGLNDHEQAVMWQTYGYIQSSQDQYKQAAESFQKALAFNALPDSAQRGTRYNLAQLYLATENFGKALETLLIWFGEAPDPGSQAYYMLAIAYVQNEELDKALEPALVALEKSSKPKESWLQLALSLQFERKNYREVVGLLDRLLARFPKKSYWLQLSGTYAELGEEENALATLQLAYVQGLLTKNSELVNLARMYLYHQIPYRAARVVEQGMEDGLVEKDADTWGLLADSWLHAREYDKAVEPLAEAAQLSDEGDRYMRLGLVHLERQSWREAVAAFEAAIAKGGIPDEGRAQLLIGIASASADDDAAARRAFKKARKHPKTANAAEGWLKHLDR